jgi:hypothetical protein
MADTRSLVIRNATSSSGTWSAGAASFTAQLGTYGDSRAMLLVDNTDTENVVRVNVEYGDGERAILGDLDVDIAVSSLAVIPFTDSMRFKTATTNEVTVNLNDTSDTSLTAGVLANVKTLLIEG